VHKSVEPAPQFSSIMSWNFNGFQSKKYMIKRVLYDEKVGIFLMQETLHNSASSPLCLQGYNTFLIEQVHGFLSKSIVKEGV
jgi:exonuclease III